mmetsp:Transcript_1000/g.3535  ORF Transcript_1000/g.3535 Transcript_1000/m.3535 type:complete len:602 (-) Transcript_1000:273-2078(-)|eukprot:scaffold1411_cov396-Prasinococcus_capsulatus_cf.AAC.20
MSSAIESPASKPLVLKATYKGETRRFVERVGEEDCVIGLYMLDSGMSSDGKPQMKLHEKSVRRLEKTVRRTFGIDGSVDLKLCYKDEDGDTVTLGDVRDLEDALQLQGLNPLRLDVVERTASISPGKVVSATCEWRAGPSASDLNCAHPRGSCRRGAMAAARRAACMSTETRSTAENGNSSKMDARFVADQTILDGAVVRPGEVFEKVWTMRNNGTQAWPAATDLVHVGGDHLPANGSQLTRAGKSFVHLQLPGAGVQPGDEVPVSVTLQAPQEPGRYTAYFRLGYKLTEEELELMKQKVLEHTHKRHGNCAHKERRLAMLSGEGVDQDAPILKRFGHRIWCQVNVVPEGTNVADVLRDVQASASLNPRMAGFAKPVVKAIIVSFLCDLQVVDEDGKPLAVGAQAIQAWADGHKLFVAQPQAKQSVEKLRELVGVNTSTASSSSAQAQSKDVQDALKHDLCGPGMRDVVHTIISELHIIDKDGKVSAKGAECLEEWVKRQPFFGKNGGLGSRGVKVLRQQVAAFLERTKRTEDAGDKGLNGDNSSLVDPTVPKLRLALPLAEDVVKAQAAMDVVPVAYPVGYSDPGASSDWVNLSNVPKSG